MKTDKVFLLITLITVYMLLTTHFHLIGLPFLAFSVVLVFPFFIFLPGYCVVKIVFLSRSLKLHEIIIYSFSLGVLTFSFIGFLFFILHCLPLVKYFVIMLSYIFYILMRLRTRAFEDDKS
jgi:hypothetical protein